MRFNFRFFFFSELGSGEFFCGWVGVLLWVEEIIVFDWVRCFRNWVEMSVGYWYFSI